MRKAAQPCKRQELSGFLKEPVVRVELTTVRLQIGCSTTELNRQGRAILHEGGKNGKHELQHFLFSVIAARKAYREKGVKKRGQRRKKHLPPPAGSVAPVETSCVGTPAARGNEKYYREQEQRGKGRFPETLPLFPKRDVLTRGMQPDNEPEAPGNCNEVAFFPYPAQFRPIPPPEQSVHPQFPSPSPLPVSGKVLPHKRPFGEQALRLKTPSKKSTPLIDCHT